jgi:hypothetical protein
MKLYSWVIGNRLHFESSESIGDTRITIKIPQTNELIYSTKVFINKNVDYWFQPNNNISKFDEIIVEAYDINSKIIFNEKIHTKYVKTDVKNKVYYVLPWDSNKNIGKYLNEVMSKLDDDDWLCIMDCDTIHTTTFFGKRIEEIIDKNPEYQLFVPYTNRGVDWQIPSGTSWESNDMLYHRNIGEDLWISNGTNVINVTYNKPEVWGVSLLMSKKTWGIIGNFTENLMNGFDTDVHIKVKNSGLKVGLMTGIYVYHWYRGGNKYDKFHLLNSEVKIK